MRAEDLMVGDLVLAEGKPLQVTNVSCLGGDIIRVMNPIMSYDIAYASNIVALSNGAKDINKIEPIPLTPKILEKNGWKVTKIQNEPDHYWHDDIPFCIPVNNKRQHSNGYDVTDEKMFCDDFFENAYIRLEFVHELQHALRLCGIEKEIVL